MSDDYKPDKLTEAAEKEWLETWIAGPGDKRSKLVFHQVVLKRYLFHNPSLLHYQHLLQFILIRIQSFYNKFLFHCC